MKKTVRLSDIAEKLQVSTVTVSNALAGQKGVSEELRARIKQVAAENGADWRDQIDDIAEVLQYAQDEHGLDLGGMIFGQAIQAGSGGEDDTDPDKEDGDGDEPDKDDAAGDDSDGKDSGDGE